MFLYAVCQNVYNKLFKKYNSLCLGLFYKQLTRVGPWTRQTYHEELANICKGYLSVRLTLIYPHQTFDGRFIKHWTELILQGRKLWKVSSWKLEIRADFCPCAGWAAVCVWVSLCYCHPLWHSHQMMWPVLG